MAEIGNESNLGGLLLEIAGQVGAAEATAQALLGATEEVFGGIVGALDHGDYVAVVVTDSGMAEEVIAIGLEILEDDRLGFLGAFFVYVGAGTASQVASRCKE